MSPNLKGWSKWNGEYNYMRMNFINNIISTVPVEHMYLPCIPILVVTRRKGVDDFGIEKHGLLKDAVLHDVLHVLFTGEYLTFNRFFLKGAEDMRVRCGL